MPPSPLRLGLDVDGVLADFPAGFQPLLDQVQGHRAQAWGQVAQSPTFWADLPPLRDLTPLCAALEQCAEVYFLTRRFGVRAQHQTAQWLRAHLPCALHPAVILVRENREKADLARALHLDLHIDDSMEVGKHFRRDQGFALVHSPHWPDAVPLRGQVKVQTPEEALEGYLEAATHQAVGRPGPGTR